jgi:hypothetical protein
MAVEWKCAVCICKRSRGALIFPWPSLRIARMALGIILPLKNSCVLFLLGPFNRSLGVTHESAHLPPPGVICKDAWKKGSARRSL